MPNWCSNRTTIQGSVETLEWLQSIHFSFEHIRPRPANEDNWYDWNCQNWGTKWDCDDVEMEMEEGNLKLYYITAWSPPIALLKYLSEQHQLKISNYFSDEAYGFIGQTEIMNGMEHTEFIEPHDHDDQYLQEYAQNHSWFNYERWREFIREMEGQPA